MEILELKINKNVTNPYVLYKDLMAANLPSQFSASEKGFSLLNIGTEETLNEVLRFLSTWENKKTDEEQILEDQETIKAEALAKEEKRMEEFLIKALQKHVKGDSLMDSAKKETVKEKA